MAKTKSRKAELKKGLSAKRILFCEYYTSYPDFGNATAAYARAYGKDLKDKTDYKVCRANGYRLLANADILKYCNYLLNEVIMNHETVDTQLAYLIFQHEDKTTKLGAIKEFNKLKGRIEDKLKVDASDPVKKILEKFGIKEGEDIGKLRTTKEDPSKSSA